MPNLSPVTLTALAGDILKAAGADDRVAASVAAHLVDNNLRGTDSHGVIRIPYYLDLIDTRFIDPRAVPKVADDGGHVIEVDGADGFGIVAMEAAVEQLIATTPRHGLAAATVVRCGHTGRIGAYADALADHGMMAIVLGGGGHKIWPAVAPYGGAKGLLGTNPYAFALPGGRHGNVVADFATSATANGKLAVARAKGEPAPAGQIIDKTGKPTVNVDDYFDGGAILPAAGQKGYGMSLIAELVGFALLPDPLEYNWLVIALDIASLRPDGGYGGDAQGFLDQIKAVPPAAGFKSVQIPGELERNLKASREADGIPVAAGIWDGIAEAAATVGVDARGYLKEDRSAP
jgi:LDH2 family malate/lactate/ureidoglycolate dehydrogenase